MSPNLLRAILLVLLIVGAVYFFSSDGPIANTGSLTLTPGANQTGNNGAQAIASAVTSGAEAVASAAETVTETAMGEVSEVVKRVTNPQVDDDLNALPYSEAETTDKGQGKRVHFQEVAGCDGLNVVKHNKSVLPHPQYSNNYTPLNGHVSGYRGSVCHASPQEIDQVPSRCDSGLSCYPRDTVTAQELLPRDDPYNMWSQVNPETPGHLADKNFLESGHHFGINTTGSSLRNPNLQLRADPPIPQIPVSIWQQSTIEPDTNRRAFEIGCAY